MITSKLFSATTGAVLLAVHTHAQAPSFDSQPVSLALLDNQVAVFQVRSPNAQAYHWSKDGSPLTLNDRISGVTGPVLTINPVMSADAGIYSVTCSNVSGLSTSSPARLWMNLALPLPVTTNLVQINNSGETAVLSAIVSGSSPMHCEWVRYGQALVDENRRFGATSTNLTIPGLTAADSGWYWLVASNPAGPIASSPIRLTVLTPGISATAANYYEGAWTNGESGSWLAQTEFTHDGVAALRSPPIPFSSSTFTETTVYGPGELSFFWTVSSEAGWDPLICLIDGVEQARISGEKVPGWEQVKIPISYGSHTVRWVFSVDYAISGTYDAGFLDEVYFEPVPLISLNTALKPFALPVKSSGDAAWFGQTPVNHDGSGAARSGYIGAYQYSEMTTTVTGPGKISYWWKVSSEPGYDVLIFLVDGVEKARISGEVDWTKAAVDITWGVHTLEWRYSKDYRLDEGYDAGWVGELTYAPVGLASLSDAAGGLNNWTADGDLPFFGQNAITFDGSAALQSGPISANQRSSAHCMVTGPGTVLFRWKVSSEHSDLLDFALDDVRQESIGQEVDWTTRSYIITPGSHALRWTYSKDSSIDSGSDTAWIDTLSFLPAPSLPAALNAEGLPWTNAGGWFSENQTTRDGVAAARSPFMGDNQSATLETTLVGPGSFSFWWKVSSEYSDPLIFLIDGVEQKRTAGEKEWSQEKFMIPKGLHTASWRYQKDHSISVGTDAAWVDEVNYTSLESVALNPILSPNDFRVTVPTQPGYNYTLEYADSLVDPIVWTPALPSVAGDGLVKILAHHGSAQTEGGRFYRVKISE